MLGRFVLLCLLSVITAFAQIDTVPSLHPLGRDVVRDSLRRARATRFNVRLPFSMLEKAPGRVTYPSVRLFHEAQPELPHQASDTILIGEVVAVQPFLSSDGKGLYTEYAVSVSKVLKSASPTFPAPIVGQSVTLFREGGVARLPNGNLVRHDIRNDFTPTLHQKCLLFLNYEPDLEGFVYRKFWLIENDSMRPVFPEDVGLGQGSAVAGKPLSNAIALLANQKNN